MQRGYVLVSTMLLGLAIAIASSTFLQYVVNSSAQLTDGTYTALAEEAAEAGAVYAADCIGQYSGDLTNLTPNTSCDRIPQGGAYLSTSQSGFYTLRSKFKVAQYTEQSDNFKLGVTGSLEILRGATTIKTYTVTKTSYVSKKVLHVATAATSYSSGGAAPSAPTATPIRATALSVDRHSCLIANGQLYCWGDNSSGQLGLGNKTPQNQPTQVPFFSSMTVTKVAVGTGNTCAIANGALYCWGDDTYGQIGNAVTTTTPYLTPVAAKTNTIGSGKVTDISLTQSLTTPGSACAIIDGTGYCWGRNDKQQLGISTASSKNTTNKNTPTAVTALLSGYGNKLTKISVGDGNGCSIVIGFLVCWGGQSSTAAPPALVGQSTPTPYGLYVDNVAVVGNTTCATLSGFYHSVSCHGQSNALPALGTTTTSPQFLFNGSPLAHAPDAMHPLPAPYYRPYEYDGAPFPIAGAPDSGISGSNELLCVTAYARPWCAGSPSAYIDSPGAGTPFALMDSGELNNYGSNTLGYFHATGIIGAGNDYGCMLSNGSLFCWGKDTNGTQARGAVSQTTNFPLERVAQGIIGAQISQSTNTTTDTNDFAWTYAADGPVTVGAHHACAVVNNYIVCWGGNDKGQLGVGNTLNSAEPATSGVVLQYGADKISAGGDTTCSVSQGSLFCWGDNTYGQLAVSPSTLSSRPAPREITIKDSNGQKLLVTDVSVGAKNVCAIAGNAQLYCWGDNTDMQVGTGVASLTPIITPTLVTGLPTPLGPSTPSAVTAISVGDRHACAIVNSDAYCWGANDTYQLGYSTSTADQPPRQVTGGTTGVFTAIAAGSNFTCGISNGVVSCWGANNSGQLGNSPAVSPTAKRATPANVAGNTTQATSVSAGSGHACAVLQGATYCWGSNSSHQVNSSGTSPVTAPSKIIDGSMVDGRVTIGIGAGGSTSCNVANGLISCWGNNDKLQAGSTTGSFVSAPLTSQWYRYGINQNKGIFY